MAVTGLGDVAADLIGWTASIGYERDRATIVFGAGLESGSRAAGELVVERVAVRWWVAGSYRL